MLANPSLPKNNPVVGLSVAIAVHVLLAVLVLVKLRPMVPPRLPEPVAIQLIKEPPAPKIEVKPMVTPPVVHQTITVPVLPMPEVKMVEKPAVELPKPVERPNAITLPAPAPPPPAAPAHGDIKDLDFQSQLLAHLNGLKRYPADARRQGKTGVVMVRFRIDRRGHLLNYRIEQGSGHAILDDETARLMQRAEPYPAPPDSVPGAELEFVVPVQYKLG